MVVISVAEQGWTAMTGESKFLISTFRFDLVLV